MHRTQCHTRYFILCDTPRVIMSSFHETLRTVIDLDMCLLVRKNEFILLWVLQKMKTVLPTAALRRRCISHRFFTPPLPDLPLLKGAAPPPPCGEFFLRAANFFLLLAPKVASFGSLWQFEDCS